MGLLDRFNNGELLFLFILVSGLVCAVLGIVAGTWLKARQLEIDAALKKEMLSRGMSAEEIQAVIEAGSRGKQTAAILQAMSGRTPEEA